MRLFSQNDVLFLFYFLINPAGTTANRETFSHLSSVLNFCNVQGSHLSGKNLKTFSSPGKTGK